MIKVFLAMLALSVSLVVYAEEAKKTDGNANQIKDVTVKEGSKVIQAGGDVINNTTIINNPVPPKPPAASETKPKPKATPKPKPKSAPAKQSDKPTSPPAPTESEEVHQETHGDKSPAVNTEGNVNINIQ